MAADHTLTTSAVVLLGDTLECLAALCSDPAVVLPHSTGGRSAQTVVVGVNGAAVRSRRGLRTVLLLQAQACVSVCMQRPTLRHLIVVVDASPGIAETRRKGGEIRDTPASAAWGPACPEFLRL